MYEVHGHCGTCGVSTSRLPCWSCTLEADIQMAWAMAEQKLHAESEAAMLGGICSGCGHPMHSTPCQVPVLTAQFDGTDRGGIAPCGHCVRA